MPPQTHYVAIGFSKSSGPVLAMEYSTDPAWPSDTVRLVSVRDEKNEAFKFEAPLSLKIPKGADISYRGEPETFAGKAKPVHGQVIYLEEPMVVTFLRTHLNDAITLSDIDGIMFCNPDEQNMLITREIGEELLQDDGMCGESTSLESITETAENGIRLMTERLQQFRNRVLKAGYQGEVSFEIMKGVDEALTISAYGQSPRMSLEELFTMADEHIYDNMFNLERFGGRARFSLQEALAERERLTKQLAEINQMLGDGQ